MDLPLPFLALTLLLGAAIVLWKPVSPLVLFGLLAPLGLTALPGSLDVVTVLAALTIAAAGWEYLINGEPLLPTGLAVTAAIIWSLGMVASVAFSSDPARAAILGSWQILAAWLAVSIAYLARTPRRLEYVTASVLVGASIVAAAGLRNGLQISGAFNASVVEGRAMGVFSQPNEYGLYCSMVWAFSLAIACLCHGYLRVLGMVCAIISLAGLAASFSRGSWLGALVAMVVMAALIPQTRRPQAIAAAALVAVIAASLVVVPYWQLPGLLLSRLLSMFSGEVNPYDNRPALLAEGLREFGEQPLFGVGPNMYPVESRTLPSGVRTLEGEHAHNLVVTQAAEQGIVGLLALALFVAAVVSAVRTARRTAMLGQTHAAVRQVPLASAVTLSAMGSLTAILAAGLVDYPLRNSLTRTTAWMFVGLALAGQKCLDAQSARARSMHRDADEQVTT